MTHNSNAELRSIPNNFKEFSESLNELTIQGAQTVMQTLNEEDILQDDTKSISVRTYQTAFRLFQAPGEVESSCITISSSRSRTTMYFKETPVLELIENLLDKDSTELPVFVLRKTNKGLRKSNTFYTACLHLSYSIKKHETKNIIKSTSI